LFLADEMLGPILLTHHNLTYYQRLLSDARRAIEEDRFLPFFESRISGWKQSDAPSSLG
jgi:queuine tRNA-ribosyltransferase